MKKSISVKEYFENFPHTSFRNNQDNVIRQICEAFNSDCKYVILEAPTGFGKSAIAMTVARTLGSSFVPDSPAPSCTFNHEKNRLRPKYKSCHF